MRTLLLAALVLATACERRPAADEAARDTAAAAPVRLHAVGGFSTPESILHDTLADVYLVSNINGAPAGRDGNGFISRLTPDGRLDSVPFIAGGRDGVTLNAPKGMAIRGDTLWVSDIDVLRRFDRATGAPRGSVAFGPRAGFLNDVALGPDGAIYVSETGVRFAEGGMETTGLAGVFRVAPGDAIERIVRDTALAAPNGITAHAGRLVMGSFTGPQIYAWTPGQPAIAPVGRATGGVDGLEVLDDGRMLASVWSDSSLVLVGDSAVAFIRGLPSPADFTVDRRRNRIIVPLFMDDRVEVWQLP